MARAVRLGRGPVGRVPAQAVRGTDGDRSGVHGVRRRFDGAERRDRVRVSRARDRRNHVAAVRHHQPLRHGEGVRQMVHLLADVRRGPVGRTTVRRAVRHVAVLLSDQDRVPRVVFRADGVQRRRVRLRHRHSPILRAEFRQPK